MVKALSKTNRTKAPEAIARSKTASGGQRHIELTVGGMTCTHCPSAVEKALAAIDGIVSAHVNLANRLAAVNYDPSHARAIDLVKTIRGAVPRREVRW